MTKTPTRRDFLDGLLVGSSSSLLLGGLGACARQTPLESTSYPPRLSGMRGSAPNSFQLAHSIIGLEVPPAADSVDSSLYDLIVVGAGISGLTAAFAAQEKNAQSLDVLVLEGSDDFGGHASRNEFNHAGQTLIGYGGSQSIDTPSSYSKDASDLLEKLGIDTSRFYEFYDRQFYRSRDLTEGILFGASTFGRNQIEKNVFGLFSRPDDQSSRKIFQRFPVAAQTKEVFNKILSGFSDNLTDAVTIEDARQTLYFDYLKQRFGADDIFLSLINNTVRGLWGVGWDSLSVLEAYRFGYLGTKQLNFGKVAGGPLWKDEPYIFHFPDGNASIARALIGKLIPNAFRPKNMEELTVNRVDYGQLDRPDSTTKVRLNAMCLSVSQDESGIVELTYAHGGTIRSARAKHAILACNNRLIPHLLQNMPEEQIAAVNYAARVPLVYANVHMRNWQAFSNAGFRGFYVPGSTLIHSFSMDFPVSIGSYKFSATPSEPTIIHCEYIPTNGLAHLSRVDQYKAGRRRLLETPFSDIENNILELFTSALGSSGFDAEKDILGITVNRWAHGYAYAYNDYWDDPSFSRYNGPHILARRKIGNISIANSDSEAYAYVNGAIDAAYRAVKEQFPN